MSEHPSDLSLRLTTQARLSLGPEFDNLVDNHIIPASCEGDLSKKFVVVRISGPSGSIKTTVAGALEKEHSDNEQIQRASLKAKLDYTYGYLEIGEVVAFGRYLGCVTSPPGMLGGPEYAKVGLLERDISRLIKIYGNKPYMLIKENVIQAGWERIRRDKDGVEYIADPRGSIEENRTDTQASLAKDLGETPPNGIDIEAFNIDLLASESFRDEVYYKRELIDAFFRHHRRLRTPEVQKELQEFLIALNIYDPRPAPDIFVSSQRDGSKRTKFIQDRAHAAAMHHWAFIDKANSTNPEDIALLDRLEGLEPEVYYMTLQAEDPEQYLEDKKRYFQWWPRRNLYQLDDPFTYPNDPEKRRQFSLALERHIATHNRVLVVNPLDELIIQNRGRLQSISAIAQLREQAKYNRALRRDLRELRHKYTTL